MSEARDADHAALHAAERAAFDGTDLEELRSLGDLRALVDQMTSDAWWPGPAVAVRAARSDAASSRAVESAAGVELRLAGPQLTWATVAHELAHALAGVGEGHGSVYRRALLDVVQVLTNQDSTDRRGLLHVDQLAGAFADAGLSTGARRWPAPPSAISGPIAL